MKELEQAIENADLDSISLGSTIATIVLKHYGKYNSELFLDGFMDILKDK